MFCCGNYLTTVLVTNMDLTHKIKIVEKKKIIAIKSGKN